MTPEQIREENAKRDRHVTPEQRRQWADDMLAQMVHLESYRRNCTKEARLEEQTKLLKIHTRPSEDSNP
ncbi:MAG: hypothetical protein U0930_04075 [Pirellulales bacterium]